MSALRIRAATRRDRPALTALLCGLSEESAHQRFQTAIGAQPSRVVVDALLPDGGRGAAMLGFVGGTLVAHGMWVRVGAAAEIALLVADDHQRRGVGTELADALLADLAARGIAQVEVFTGADNRAVPRMLARQAPGAERVLDGATASYSFALERRGVAAA